MSVSDYFLPSTSVTHVTDKDYAQLNALLNAIKAFARSTYQRVYIVDYFKQDILYVSDDLACLYAEDTNSSLWNNSDIFLEKIPVDDKKLVLEINASSIKFFDRIPKEERTHYSLSYDFHMVNEEKTILFHHCATPILLTKEGKIWLSLCTLSPSTRKKSGQARIHKNGASLFYEYNFSMHQWEEKNMIQLSEYEREVLLLSLQGHTMTEISAHLCKSIDSVKSYKRTLFAKLRVKNISEALAYAINYKLF